MLFRGRSFSSDRKPGYQWASAPEETLLAFFRRLSSRAVAEPNS
jgi:hypothetical protein